MDAARGHQLSAPEVDSALHFAEYASRLQRVLKDADWTGVARLGRDLRECWGSGRQVFLCGNGGSAGNAIHLANDFLYGVAKTLGAGLRVTALPSNPAVLTCLANDLGFDEIFSHQLAVLGQRKDVLIALSGSGNSANIVKALQQAAKSGMRSYAILGYDGGKAKSIADVAIHFAVDDMQIAEDMQLVVGHMLMQWLYGNPPARVD
jgi:D-sedoheptulose 7-phosphate isomerase